MRPWVRTVAGIAFAAAMAGATVAQPACTAPDVAILRPDPTSATLTWTARQAATGYFLQYSTGKFPTQLRLPVPAEGGTVIAGLRDLTPGVDYTVSLCESLQSGSCPAPDSASACNSEIIVPGILHVESVTPPLAGEAACKTHRDTVWRGHLTGSQIQSVVDADSADACCRACAVAPSRLPYVGLCRHYTYDPSAGRCYQYSTVEGRSSAPGAVSGEVIAWPAR